MSCGCRARERRQQQEALDKQKKLGEGGDDVDDVLAWVSRSRVTEQQRKAAADAERRSRGAGAARRSAVKREDSEDDEDDHDMPSAAELAGAKVKHSADEIEEGETVILTLGQLATAAAPWQAVLVSPSALIFAVGGLQAAAWLRNHRCSLGPPGTIAGPVVPANLDRRVRGLPEAF
jgi:hypothetical protein